MKRYERFKRKIATIATVVLSLQIVTVGLLSGNVAQAATAQLVVSSPSEGGVITTGLEVSVSGTVVLADDTVKKDYKVELDFNDGGDKTDSTLSGTENTWSKDYTYASSGSKWVSVNLLQKHWNEAETDFVWESAVQKTVNFTIVYPSKPASPVVTGSLGLPKDAPVANFDLDWEDNTEALITYKAAYRVAGSTGYTLEDGLRHSLSETTIKGLKTNTEYEFVVYAFKGDFAMSEPSDPESGRVDNITSLATSADYSKTKTINVAYTIVEGENPITPSGYVELWYKGPSDAEFIKFKNSENETDFTTSPIAFEATEEGKYLFYTVAVDTEGFQELSGICINALDLHAANGGKCIPDTTTIVDTVNPAVVTDLKAVAGIGKVDLSWTTTVDSAPSSGLGETKVYRDGLLLPQVVTGSSFTDLNVVNGTTYSYYVVVFDKAGNPLNPVDGKSNVVTATPFAPVVETPSVTLAVATVYGNDSGAGLSDNFVPDEVVPAEVKSDTTGTTTTTKPDEGDAKTAEKKNIPLWGIIFLLILAGIGGYLFYAQAPEEDKKKKTKK